MLKKIEAANKALQDRLEAERARKFENERIEAAKRSKFKIGDIVMTHVARKMQAVEIVDVCNFTAVDGGERVHYRVLTSYGRVLNKITYPSSWVSAGNEIENTMELIDRQKEKGKKKKSR